MSALQNQQRESAQRILDIAAQCVKCGLCLPACPTYQLQKTEAESPRGRIAIAQAIAAGATIESSALAHLDSCLNCGACETTCPSGVRYQQLIVGARAHTHMHRHESLKRSAARWLLEHPRLLRLSMPFARLLYRPFRRISLRAGHPIPVSLNDKSTESLRSIALLAGCTGNALEQTALDATSRLLRRCGFEVHSMPPLCCGALARHSGDLQGAARLALELQQALASAAVDHCTGIVSGCATQCTEVAKQHAPFCDPMELLWSHREHLRFRRVDHTAALHLPCTQRMNAASVQATLNLLGLVPGLKLVTLPHRGRCCGGAGTYFLDHSETAERLRQPTLDDLAQSGAHIVLSTNIGCRIQIAAGCALPVLHPLEFLEQLLEK
jgi:glycolate oxidase iron-sulfur subunit